MLRASGKTGLWVMAAFFSIHGANIALAPNPNAISLLHPRPARSRCGHADATPSGKNAIAAAVYLNPHASPANAPLSSAHLRACQPPDEPSELSS